MNQRRRADGLAVWTSLEEEAGEGGWAGTPETQETSCWTGPAGMGETGIYPLPNQSFHKQPQRDRQCNQLTHLVRCFARLRLRGSGWLSPPLKIWLSVYGRFWHTVRSVLGSADYQHSLHKLCESFSRTNTGQAGLSALVLSWYTLRRTMRELVWLARWRNPRMWSLRHCYSCSRHSESLLFCNALVLESNAYHKNGKPR